MVKSIRWTLFLLLVSGAGCSSDDNNSGSSQETVDDADVVQVTDLVEDTIPDESPPEISEVVDHEPEVAVGCVDDDVAGTEENPTAVAFGDQLDDLAICEGATDYFVLTLAEGERAVVVVLFTHHDDGDIDVRVWDSDEGLVNSDDAGPGWSYDDNEVVPFVAGAAGDYLIGVAAFDAEGEARGENTYSLLIQGGCRIDADCDVEGQVCDRQTSACGAYIEPDCGADFANDVSLDPNGTDSQANPLEIGSTVTEVELTQRAICLADADYYAVTVADGDGLSLSIDASELGSQIVVALLDSAGELVAFTRNSAVWGHLPGDDYLLEVTLQEDEDAPVETDYDLSVEYLVGGCEANRDCGDGALGGLCDEETGVCLDLEGNGEVQLGGFCDSFDDCDPGSDEFSDVVCLNNSVSPDGWICSEYADCATEDLDCGDLDCLREPTGAGVVCVPGCANEAGEPDDAICPIGTVCLLGDDDEPRCELNECTSDSVCLDLGRAEDRCVYVNDRFAGGCTDEISEHPGCTGDDSDAPEFDGDITADTPLDSGAVEAIACDGDYDIYRVTIAEPGTITAVVSWESSDSDLDVYIYQPGALNPVGGGLTFTDSEAEPPHEETAEAALVPAGTYLVRVVPFEVPSPIDYSLTLSFAADTCGDNDDCLVTNPARAYCDLGNGSYCADLEVDTPGGLGADCDTRDDCDSDHECFVFRPPSPAMNLCSRACNPEAEDDCGTDYRCEILDEFWGTTACVPDS